MMLFITALLLRLRLANLDRTFSCNTVTRHVNMKFQFQEVLNSRNLVIRSDSTYVVNGHRAQSRVFPYFHDYTRHCPPFQQLF